MRTLFADSGYWIALLNPRDQHHSKATSVAVTLGEASIVTTQMALAETFNAMASAGEGGRRHAAQLLNDLENDPDVEIVPQADAQFRAAVDRYASRADKTWSLTDCASFLVMEERGITEALAYDSDFLQAGFTALLREEQGYDRPRL